MKYLKTYRLIVTQPDLFESDMIEDVHTKPQIGDYILIKVDTTRNPMTHEFINNNIGKIIDIIKDDKYGGSKTIVEYKEEPPTHCMEYFNHDNHNNTYNCWFKLDHQDTFAPTIEKLKTKLNAQKYNL